MQTENPLSHYQFDDNSFEQHFSEGNFAPALFSHEAHLRLAWIHLRKYGLAKGIDNLCRQILNFVEKIGAIAKFSSPLTIAAAELIHECMETSSADNFPDFIREFPQLLQNLKELVSAKEKAYTLFEFNSDEFVETFDELPLWAAPFGWKLLDNIRYKRGINALDIGFGAGFPLTELAMRLGDSCKVYGIDPWEAAIRRAEKKIKYYNIHNIEIINGVAEEIPLPDHSIDLIVSNNGLNNVSDLSKAIGECARILKKGGQFIQTMNTNESFSAFYETMEAVLLQLGMKDEIGAMKAQIYTKRKPIEEVVQLLSENNFSVKPLLNEQFCYKFTDGTSLLKHYFIRMGFLAGWKNIVPAARQQEVFSRIESSLNEKAEMAGYIELAVPFVVLDCA